MKIIVIGLGSMGRRRIRLIKKYNPNYEITGIDLRLDRRQQCEEEHKIRTSDKLDMQLESGAFDCAFICTSPLAHAGLINKCLNNNLHVFTELNLVSDLYDINLKLSRDKNKVLFLSSTFLYREEIKKIEERVHSQGQNLNYSYHVGQYLPDWHPWESYQDYFVGNKRTNGCRELFAIELPWLIQTFGEIVNFHVSKSKMTSLKIDYPDNYILLLEHKSGHKGTLLVDVVSRKAVRNLEVFGETLYLTWAGNPESLEELDIESGEMIKLSSYSKVDRLDGYSQFVIENAYYAEIESFFAEIKQGIKPRYSFEQDKTILELIDKIEANDNDNL